MMEEELKELKSTLKSLVVSSPTTMDVRTLVRDYRNMVGGPLPYNKYGYTDPVHFLQERCTDCFLFEGVKSNPVLTLIVSNNLKHIDRFVQKQKVSAKHKGKRRSVPESIIDPPINDNLICNTFKKKPLHNNSQLTQKTKPLNKNTTFPPKNNIPMNNNDCPVINIGTAPIKYDTSTRNGQKSSVFIETNDIKLNNIKTEIIKTHHDFDIKMNDTQDNDTACNVPYDYNKENKDNNPESPPASALSKFLKKRLSHYNSSESLQCSESDEVSKEDTDSGRHSSSSHGSTPKQARLDQLKKDIFALILDSDDGIWCTEIMRLYYEKYGRELNFNQFGHTSVISLMYSMEDRVAIMRPIANGDWLIQDASRAGAGAGVDARARARAAAERRLPHAAAPRPLPAEPGDALPGIDYDPDVFPEDCMHYMDAIPTQPLAELKRGDMLEVIIGEVYSPSHFWMLRVGPQHNLPMEDIMDEMTVYYTRGEGRGRVLARGAIRVGQYCSCEYERDWHRSLIVHIIDSQTVKVRHVDYGTVETVSTEGLKPLLRRWAALPAQAVRARLAGCRPCAAQRRWPRPACTAFLQLVRDTRLYANLLAVAHEEDIVETFLIDTTGETDACITRELIRAEHADARPDSALTVSASPQRRGTGVTDPAEEERHANWACDALDVRSVAESVVRFARSDLSCSASQVVGPARPMRVWDADADAQGGPCAPSLRLAGRLAAIRRPARSPHRHGSDDGSDSSGESVASALSSRLLIRRLRCDRAGRSVADTDESAGSGGSAVTLSSKVLRRKLQLHDKRALVD